VIVENSIALATRVITDSDLPRRRAIRPKVNRTALANWAVSICPVDDVHYLARYRAFNHDQMPCTDRQRAALTVRDNHAGIDDERPIKGRRC